MGSDGLDDSWVTMPKLQHFYAQTLEIFANQGRDKTVDELGDYLTKLSATGSRDDMSWRAYSTWICSTMPSQCMPQGRRA